MSLVDNYIKEITELLQKCEDPSILDFIYQLLRRHEAQT